MDPPIKIQTWNSLLDALKIIFNVKNLKGKKVLRFSSFLCTKFHEKCKNTITTTKRPFNYNHFIALNKNKQTIDVLMTKYSRFIKSYSMII